MNNELQIVAYQKALEMIGTKANQNYHVTIYEVESVLDELQKTLKKIKGYYK